eukprot:TRINITY_DN2197_c0_g1::TRINITY_DN2197_c0_g1_i2::g.12905::m.12905 TRINITY_DN2197_c0_g1::TRINITY_DN2197_c0_g1_i2::g.12905  ORF type:complete len:116 (+),score=-8.09,GATA/PF00320.22/0.77 TRINITY_DN2197_c0_g1_i2:457-804(+)
MCTAIASAQRSPLELTASLSLPTPSSFLSHSQTRFFITPLVKTKIFVGIHVGCQCTILGPGTADSPKWRRGQYHSKQLRRNHFVSVEDSAACLACGISLRTATLHDIMMESIDRH